VKQISASGAASGSSATSPLAVVVTTEGAGQHVLGACTDGADNVATLDSGAISIDRTPPTVSVTGVAQGAAYLLGAVPQAGCSTSDALSGVATPASPTITGGTANGVGAFTATCSGATDRAGNVAPAASVSYSVRYVFTGFLPPLTGDFYSGLFKLGRTIPAKWILTDGKGATITALSAVASLRVAANADCLGDADGTPFDPGSSSQVGLRNDGTQYIFNWQTSGLAPGCYTFDVTLDDGTGKSTTVRLR
jgi:hypothetical protein